MLFALFPSVLFVTARLFSPAPRVAESPPVNARRGRSIPRSRRDRRCVMTELRNRMDNDLLVRGMAERTRETYLAAVTRLARHYRRPPDQLCPQEVQAYLIHMLREEQLAWSTCSIAVHAFRFLYHTTLGRPEATFTIPGPRHRQTLPEILSPGEVRRLLEATVTRKQRAVLATTYGAGL